MRRGTPTRRSPDCGAASSGRTARTSGASRTRGTRTASAVSPTVRRTTSCPVLAPLTSRRGSSPPRTRVCSPTRIRQRPPPRAVCPTRTPVSRISASGAACAAATSAVQEIAVEMRELLIPMVQHVTRRYLVSQHGPVDRRRGMVHLVGDDLSRQPSTAQADDRKRDAIVAMVRLRDSGRARKIVAIESLSGFDHLCASVIDEHAHATLFAQGAAADPDDCGAQP